MSFQNEKVIEEKICKQCDTSFSITDKDIEFYEKVSPTFGGKKYGVPSPTLCPDCRKQRRMIWWNLNKIYKRKCDSSGKEMFSMYPPNTPFPVYDYTLWWGDNWDGLSYGGDYDFNIPFLNQLNGLTYKVPRFSKSVYRAENTEYTTNAGSVKDCFLVFNADFCEDCYYGIAVVEDKKCVDCLYVKQSELCYECVDCTSCYNLSFSQQCISCKNSEFLYNCENCSFCYGCSNLVNKSYYIYNILYSKEEYFQELEKIKGKNRDENLQKKHIKGTFHKQFYSQLGEKSIGNYLLQCKNIFQSFDISEGENIFYSDDIFKGADLYDIFGFGNKLSLSYEGSVIGIESSHLLFCADCWDSCSHLIYCQLCVQNCHYCFGCIGLRNKSYCILNKQYTKEEYEKLVPQIIEHMIKTGEWGEFFPNSLSPFGYNETVAQEYFPLSRDEALKQGFSWSDYEAPFPKVEKVINVETYCNTSLLDNANNVPDDILNWAIECEITKKPFRIIKQELEFYRKHNLPIPRKHPDQRHLERMQLRNPRKLFTRHCDKCKKEIQTTYAPERPEIVYCEECYNREVY